jgi:hypothetical protein
MAIGELAESAYIPGYEGDVVLGIAGASYNNVDQISEGNGSAGIRIKMTGKQFEGLKEDIKSKMKKSAGLAETNVVLSYDAEHGFATFSYQGYKSRYNDGMVNSLIEIGAEIKRQVTTKKGPRAKSTT